MLAWQLVMHKHHHMCLWQGLQAVLAKKCQRTWSCWPHVKRQVLHHLGLLEDQSDDFKKTVLDLFDQIHLCRTQAQALLCAEAVLRFLRNDCDPSEERFARWVEAEYCSCQTLTWCAHVGLHITTRLFDL